MTNARAMRTHVDDVVARLIRHLLVGFHAELAHLAVEVRAVDAEVFGGLADVAAGAVDRLAGCTCCWNSCVASFSVRPASMSDGALAAGREDERQVLGFDRVAGREVGEPLHQVAQLADVAGPGVAFEPLAGGGGELRRAAAGAAAELAQEMLGQQQHVVAAVAQRRQLERHDVEAEVQVLAESLGADQLGQLLVRGGQHADVGVDRRAAADADDRLFLEHAEQLGLAGEAHVADLVEEQRAAGGQLELAGAGFVGVGERAFLVAEQLAFEQRFGEGGAVDGDERVLAAAAAEVDRCGRRLPCRCRSRPGSARPDRCRRCGGSSTRTAWIGRALADEQRVLRRLLDQLFVALEQLGELLRVFQRDRGVGGQLDQAALVVGGERAVALVEQLERAEPRRRRGETSGTQRIVSVR